MSKLVRLAVVPVAVLALAACGGGSSTTSSGATPTGAPGYGNGNGGGRGFGGVDLQAVQSCLSAAGISVPTPSGGFPTARPSGGTRPTDLPRPSGTGGRGGMGQVFQSKEAQAALKACGITIPTGGPRPTATAS